MLPCVFTAFEVLVTVCCPGPESAMVFSVLVAAAQSLMLGLQG